MMDRRTALTGLTAAALTTGLGGCDRGQATEDAPPLKSLVDFPLGVCAMTAQFDDPQWKSMVATHFDRLTPEWEMKMEYILQPDGSHRFDAPDRIVQLAKMNRQTVFGHTLVWYAQDGEFFQKLKGDRKAFEAAYRAYITAVVTRYKGATTGWDVVNEPIRDDSSGPRDCLWSQVLGETYCDIAYQTAHAADPACPLAMSDYHLEYKPEKRRQFLLLAERMMKRGAPLHVLGTQTHIAADLPKGAVAAAIRDMASTGLKIHVSELDISLNEAAKNALDFKNYREAQIRLVGEVAEAFAALPAQQRFGLTIWGLRDKDSWYNRAEKGLLPDEPLMFDDQGRLKPVGQALVKAFGKTSAPA
ncbi:MAG: endo-1,4-beta-xylanase [Asticcacaulis sp.]